MVIVKEQRERFQLSTFMFLYVYVYKNNERGKNVFSIVLYTCHRTWTEKGELLDGSPKEVSMCLLNE